MKKIISAAVLSAALLAGSAQAAQPFPLRVDGAAVEAPGSYITQSTTYVPLRDVAQALLPQAEVTWSSGRALVRAEGVELTAQPGACHIEINGMPLYVQHGVAARNGRILVPVRVLAQALGASVDWDAATGAVSVTSGSVPEHTVPGTEDQLYWLSRIISAESRGEPMRGQIAVGNVVLNRVASPDFPDTIYGVIFDDRWGGQFEPVRNGTIYDTPTEQSVQAAKLCLSGADVAKDSLYFLAPALTSDSWIMENRTHVMTIGSHWFYR